VPLGRLRAECFVLSVFLDDSNSRPLTQASLWTPTTITGKPGLPPGRCSACLI